MFKNYGHTEESTYETKVKNKMNSFERDYNFWEVVLCSIYHGISIEKRLRTMGKLVQ